MSEIQFEIIGDRGIEWTDTPRTLTAVETAYVLDKASRIDRVKRYREMTNATLSAAVRFVDKLTELNP